MIPTHYLHDRKVTQAAGDVARELQRLRQIVAELNRRFPEKAGRLNAAVDRLMDRMRSVETSDGVSMTDVLEAVEQVTAERN